MAAAAAMVAAAAWAWAALAAALALAALAVAVVGGTVVADAGEFRPDEKRTFSFISAKISTTCLPPPDISEHHREPAWLDDHPA